jgi:phosphomannomutase
MHTVTVVEPKSMDTDRGSYTVSKKFKRTDSARDWVDEMEDEIKTRRGNRWGCFVRIDGIRILEKHAGYIFLRASDAIPSDWENYRGILPM